MKQSKVEADVVAAFDINSVANTCYEHNFPSLKVTRVNIEHLPLEFYEKKAWDGWLMSPPCQPFTRGGKLLDDEDARSTGFLFLTGILEQMKNPPKYLFIENVLNFEVSKCHERFISVISKRGYRIHEFLVTPNDSLIGIPNDRLRYYLAAVRISDEPVAYEGTDKIYRSFETFFNENSVEFGSIRPEAFKESPSISEFIREPSSSNYTVPLKYLTDYIDYRHDIVKPSSRRSTTFTKAYGSKHIIGTGSFLQTLHLDLEYSSDDRVVLPTLGLRFFTPTEIALLHDFPIESGELSFPASVNDSQKYRLLGNSMNIRVVAMIFKILFH